MKVEHMHPYQLTSDELEHGVLSKADVLENVPLKDGPIMEPMSVLEGSIGLEDALSDLEGRLNGRTRLGILVNDRNRPTPTSLVLEHIKRTHPAIIDNVFRVNVATGTHKPPTEDDIHAILGGLAGTLKERLHVHIAKEEMSHRFVYTTSRGTELKVDRVLDEQDILLFINSIEPHYFAGFTGGRKSILPGMAAYSTVEANHSHALSPGSKPLALKGNPVHEDMDEAVRYYLKDKEHLSIQLVQGIGKVLTSVHAGDLFGSFTEGVKAAREQFCIPVGRTYDIVVAIARPPMDRTLYQAQKAIENGKLALRDGGVIILISECREGIGQSTFWDLITSSPDRERTLRSISEHYVLGYHKAAKLVQLSMRSSIYAVTSIPRDVLANGFIKGFHDLTSAITSAMSVVGKDPDILLIPDGTMTVPLVEP